MMKNIGKPCAGKPHARFDEGRVVHSSRLLYLLVCSLLADRMSADALRRLAKDLPGTFDLVDIRPAEQFTDYSIPGSHNADIADVLANPAYLTGAGPLILVDRDGSLAMQVAGILSQKTQRTVKALHGGVEAYWKDTGHKDSVKPSAAPTRSASPVVTPPVGPTPSAPTPQRKKSAGC